MQFHSLYIQKWVMASAEQATSLLAVRLDVFVILKNRASLWTCCALIRRRGVSFCHFLLQLGLVGFSRANPTNPNHNSYGSSGLGSVAGLESGFSDVKWVKFYIRFPTCIQSLKNKTSMCRVDSCQAFWTIIARNAEIVWPSIWNIWYTYHSITVRQKYTTDEIVDM